MNLRYDFQKSIIVSTVSLAISLTFSLVTLTYGQVSDRPNPVRDLIENGVLFPSGQRAIVPESSMSILIPSMNKIDEINTVLDYCYNHADGPNPVQDLIDKNLVNSSQFTGMDCGAVKQLGDNILNAVSQFKDNLIVENGEARLK